MYRLTVGRIVKGEGIFVGVDFDHGGDPLDNVRAACRAVIDKSKTDCQALWTLDLHAVWPDKLLSLRRYTVQDGHSTRCDESRHDSLKAMGLYYTVGASD